MTSIKTRGTEGKANTSQSGVLPKGTNFALGMSTGSFYGCRRSIRPTNIARRK